MRRICIATAVLCGIVAITSCQVEPKDKTDKTTYPHVAREKNIGSIPSEHFATVLDLIYSPDGKYLAIVFGEAFKRNSLVIWDIEKGRIQSKISDLDELLYGPPGSPILWNAKDNYITFGLSSEKYPMRLYDPMTGRLIKEVPISTSNASFSSDGGKLISLKGEFLHQSIAIYDTDSWTHKEYPIEDLDAEMLCWVADNKILVGGIWPRKSLGKEIDGIRPNILDAVLRIFDPATGNSGHPLIIPSVPSTSGVAHFEQPVWFGSRYIVSRDGSKATFGNGFIVDTSTLDIAKYGTDEEIRKLQLPFTDSALSPDGKYTYLLQDPHEKSKASLVINSSTGEAVTHFDAQGYHIAISPDGRHLAIGNGAKLFIYSIAINNFQPRPEWLQAPSPRIMPPHKPLPLNDNP